MKMINPKKLVCLRATFVMGNTTKIHLIGIYLAALTLCVGNVFADDAYAPQDNLASVANKAENPVGFYQRGDGVTRIKNVLIIDKDENGGYVAFSTNTFAFRANVFRISETSNNHFEGSGDSNSYIEIVVGKDTVNIRFNKEPKFDLTLDRQPAINLTNYAGRYKSLKSRLVLTMLSLGTYTGEYTSSSGTHTIKFRQLLDNTLLVDKWDRENNTLIRSNGRSLTVSKPRVSEQEVFYPVKSDAEIPPEIAAKLNAEAAEKSRIESLARKEAAEKAAYVQLQSTLSTNIFSPSSIKLPPNFLGNDMYALITKVVSGSIKPKGEYETTAAYIYRRNLSIAQSMKLKGQWKSDSLFVTTIPYFIKPSYNADSQQLMVGTIARFVPYGKTPEGKITDLWMSNIDSLVPNCRYIGLKMTPSQAAKARNNIGFLVAFKSPKIYKPLNILTYSDPMVEITVKHFWIFNTQTGEIYKKFG